VYLQDVGDLDRRRRRNSSADRFAAEIVGFRFICGTSRELEAEVKAGKISRRSFTTGSVAYVWRLPPLRQRKEDIPVLLDWFPRSRLGICPRRAGSQLRDAGFLSRVSLAGKHSRIERCGPAIVRAGR